MNAGVAPQKQHVITEWLLKAFAQPVAGELRLAAYDKLNRAYQTVDPSEFMVELDAHPTEIETAIARLEGPAAAAARRLSKRVRQLPPGMYAVVAEGAPSRSAGAAVIDKGVAEGFRVFVSEHVVGAPSRADRYALARYAGLMYQRAPKTEIAILRWGDAFESGIRGVVAHVFPGMDLQVLGGLSHRRERLVELSKKIGDQLATGSWWVVRASAADEFVLGDTPVYAGLALGHDGEWRPILAADVYGVVMPLGPFVALVMAPQRFLPFTGIAGPEEVAAAINRQTWRFAERYVLARSRERLEASAAAVDDAYRRSSVEVAQDLAEIAGKGASTANRIIAAAVIEVGILKRLDDSWRRWEDCRLALGYAIIDSSDRELFVASGHLPPACIVPRGNVVGQRPDPL